MDASGDLFGATQPNGGGDGKVCEIEKAGGAYASTATVIASFGFDQAIDAFLNSGVITDSAGDVFGVADGGFDSATSVAAAGTVFEIKKTGGTFASTPTVLAFLSFSDDGNPVGGTRC